MTRPTLVSPSPDCSGHQTVRVAECDVGPNGGLDGWCFDHQDFVPCVVNGGTEQCPCPVCDVERKLGNEHYKRTQERERRRRAETAP